MAACKLGHLSDGQASPGVAKNLTGPRLRRRLAALRYPTLPRFSDSPKRLSFKVDDDLSTRRSE